MEKDYKLQLEIPASIYLDWKKFCIKQGNPLLRKTTRYNSTATIIGMKHLMNNPQLFKKMIKELKNDN